MLSKTWEAFKLVGDARYSKSGGLRNVRCVASYARSLQLKGVLVSMKGPSSGQHNLVLCEKYEESKIQSAIELKQL